MLNNLKAIAYSDIFWIFFFGSIIGFILEGFWSILRRGKWENHSATVWGPFCIVYVIGAIVIYLLAFLLEGKNILIQYGVYAIAGSAVEYLTSLFQEISFRSKSWDYSDHAINWGGRVSFQMTVIWGILGIAFVYLGFNPLRNLFAMYDGDINLLLCILLSIFMTLNLVVSAMAVRRWSDRTSGKKVRNKRESWLDERFNDNRMEKVYSNMTFIK